MDTLRFTLKTITPLFMHGPDGESAELRPPSFKGVIRYWWRALKVLPLSKLQTQEAKLFGSAGGDQDARQSTVTLRVRHDELSRDDYYPVPRKEFFTFEGFEPGQQFDLIAHVTPHCPVDHDAVRDIIMASIYLGSFGQRARRGFGALRLVTINGEAAPDDNGDPLGLIHRTIERINPDFARDGLEIRYTGSNQPPYPWVRSVQVGASHDRWQSLIEAVDEAAHRNNSQLTGNAKGQRFASPIYVSAWQSGGWYEPVVTSLNVPDRTAQKLRGQDDTRKSFKDALP